MKRLGLFLTLAFWAGALWSETPSQLRPAARSGQTADPIAEGAGIAARAGTNQIDAPAQVTSPSDAQEAGSDTLPRLVSPPLVRPKARSANLPRTQWQHMSGNALWTRAALAALKNHGKPLVDTVPSDIKDWCPAYPQATDAARRAFWVGFLSTLAKYESTYKPWAVGGGGRWFGLLQILPGTARGYSCNAGTGEALKSGAANLSCALRIMARTVPRDGVIYAPGGRGVAADWGPLRSQSKRRDMANWLKRQAYCQPINTKRPRARP